MNRIEDRINELRRIGILTDLAPADLGDLARVSLRRKYRARETIQEEGSTTNDLIAVVQGSVRLYRSSASGEDITMATAEAGDILGLPLVAKEVKPRSGLEAVDGGTVVHQIPRVHFVQLLLHDPRLAFRALEALSSRYGLLCDRFEDLALCSISMRLARELVREVEQTGTEEIGASQEQLAARIATRRDEVQKALRPFRSEGWVHSTRGRQGLTVVDVDALASYGDADPDEDP